MSAAQPKACNRAVADPVVEIAKAAGDERRANLLRLLRHDSFSVKELAKVFGMAQPAISHHLKVLREATLVQQRREGNSIFYRRCDIHTSPLIRELFAALDEQPTPATLRRGVASVHQERKQAVRAFFESNVDALRSQRKLISETSVYAESLREIWRAHCDRFELALEVGPGDAQILVLLDEQFDEVIGIDSSAVMLEPVREQAGALRNVHLEQCEFADLECAPADVIVAAMVLHHQTSPRQFFETARNRLREGGLFLIAELDRHQHDWVADACGDLWLGFTPEEMDGWAQSVGFALRTRQFLAQRNGFTIQISGYSTHQDNQPNEGTNTP